MRTPKHRTAHEQSNNSLPRHDTCRRIIMRTPKHRTDHEQSKLVGDNDTCYLSLCTP